MKNEQQEEKYLEMAYKLGIHEITEEGFQKFNELCSKNIISKGKPEKSIIIERALEMFHKHEIK